MLIEKWTKERMKSL